jgi:hypothetical protein
MANLYAKVDGQQIVLVASTSLGASPTNLVRRWDKRNEMYIDMQQPKSISAYNTSMGGLDLSDRMFYMRTKKWLVRVFFHCINLTCKFMDIIQA